MRLWTVLVVLAGAAYAADGNLVRLTPPEMDVSAAIRTIAERKLPVKGIIVDVARGGQTEVARTSAGRFGSASVSRSAGVTASPYASHSASANAGAGPADARGIFALAP